MKWQFQTFEPLLTYAKSFVQEDFNLTKYLSVALFIAISIFINYHFNFEGSFVYQPNFLNRFIHYLLFYGLAYFGALGIVILSSKKGFIKNKKSFWILSCLGVVIISLDGSFRGSYEIAAFLFSPDIKRFMGRLMFEMKNFFLLFLPLFAIWKFTNLKRESFYGIDFNKNHLAGLKPYLIILILMVPIVFAATHDASFLKTYPKFRTYGVENFLELPKVALAAPFEFFYGLSFLNVELFFRGFLVIGMTRYLGPNAILPMVSMYAFLHFQKPFPETIGSVFGGYFLGVFAYYSKNIWGGVMVHAGVALLMEFAAFWAKG